MIEKIIEKHNYEYRTYKFEGTNQCFLGFHNETGVGVSQKIIHCKDRYVLIRYWSTLSYKCFSVVDMDKNRDKLESRATAHKLVTGAKNGWRAIQCWGALVTFGASTLAMSTLGTIKSAICDNAGSIKYGGGTTHYLYTSTIV